MTTPPDLSTYLAQLRRQHHALYPPYLLALAPGVSASDLATPTSQIYLRDRILDDPILCTQSYDYRPDAGYERRFWRWVVERLEVGVALLNSAGGEDEVDERFYEALAAFMIDDSPGSDALPKESYRTFIYDIPSWQTRTARAQDHGNTEGGSNERQITLLEEQVAVQAGTTGLRTWTAALHLAHHVLHDPSLIGLHVTGPSASPSPPTIIELGAGAGFLSILLAQLGAQVIATDLGDAHDAQRQEQGITRTPLSRLRKNVHLNPLAQRLRVLALDWTDALRPATERPEAWTQLHAENSKTLVAADVIYDPDLVPALVAAVKVLLADQHDTALFAATVRNPATLELFCETCAMQHLCITDLDLPPMPNDNPTFWDSALDRGCAVRLFRIQLVDHG